MRGATSIVRALDDHRRAAAVSTTHLGLVIAIALPFAVLILAIWFPSDYNDPP